MKKNNVCPVCGKKIMFGEGYVATKGNKGRFCSKECYEAYKPYKESSLDSTMELTQFVEEVFNPDTNDERAKLIKEIKEYLYGEGLEDEVWYNPKNYELNKTICLYKKDEYGLEVKDENGNKIVVAEYHYKNDIGLLKAVVNYIKKYALISDRERIIDSPNKIYKYIGEYLGWQLTMEYNKQLAKEWQEPEIVEIKRNDYNRPIVKKQEVKTVNRSHLKDNEPCPWHKGLTMGEWKEQLVRTKEEAEQAKENQKLKEQQALEEEMYNNPYSSYNSYNDELFW